MSIRFGDLSAPKPVYDELLERTVILFQGNCNSGSVPEWEEHPSFRIVTIVSLFFAIKGKYQFYWICAIGIYIFSFLAGFSTGQLTVGLTFIPLTLAIGYSLGWIKNKEHRTIFLCLGTLIGFLMVIYVGNLLFYPLFPLFN
ncbi:MAG: hypothetical protein ACQEXQ_24885 [Bacillota bacterium]